MHEGLELLGQVFCLPQHVRRVCHLGCRRRRTGLDPGGRQQRLEPPQQRAALVLPLIVAGLAARSLPQVLSAGRLAWTWDGDEFIGLQNSWDRDAIIAEFERLDLRQYGRFKFTLNYDAIAAADEDNFPVRSLNNFSVTSYEFFGDTYKDFAKVFYSAEPFIRSDNGNHFGESSHPSVQYTSLWLYHYSLRSLRQFEKKILNAAAYTNYWKTHRYSRHWKAAHEAYLEGRFREHYEAQLGRLRQQRRMTWPAARLRALDLDPRLPARVGPLEPIADRVPD